MGQCKFCERAVYQNTSYCILHAKKKYELTHEEFNLFLFELAKEIYFIYGNHFGVKEAKDVEEFVFYLFNKDISKEADVFINKPMIGFKDIHFPKQPENSKIEYGDLFKYVKGIMFERCVFYTNDSFIMDQGIGFKRCDFLEKIYYNNIEFEPLRVNAIFILCKFYENIEFLTVRFETELFDDCQFHKLLRFQNCKFEASAEIFNKDKPAISKNKIKEKHFIGSFSLAYSTLHTELKLDSVDIGNIDIQNCNFNKRISITFCNVGMSYVNNSEFNGLLNIYKSNFAQFHLSQSNLSNLISFDGCEFGWHERFSRNDQFQIDNKASFKAYFNNSDFLDTLAFRDVLFHNGLDLTNTIVRNPPSFYNIVIESKETNRETFRVLKYSYDSVGNTIEANKFYSFEMQKYYEELRIEFKKMRFINDKIQYIKKGSEISLLKLYGKISDYGQSYFKPLGLLLISTILLWGVDFSYKHNWFYKIIGEEFGVKFDTIFRNINSFFKIITPFKRFLIKGYEFISLIYYLIFTILIWQILIAVKRQTKR